MTAQEWITAAHESDWPSPAAIAADLAALAGVSGDESIDIWPFLECPCCGRPMIDSCYAPFTECECGPEAFSVLVHGTRYCSECASELAF